MIEACHNLSCISHGAVFIHKTTCTTTPTHQIFPQTLIWGFATHNQHSKNSPWYGTGQGMDDAMIQWTILSHSLITGYQSEATTWPVKSAIKDILITLGLNMFINNVNLIHGADGSLDLHTITQQVQANLDLWHGLLQSSMAHLALASTAGPHFTGQVTTKELPNLTYHPVLLVSTLQILLAQPTHEAQ